MSRAPGLDLLRAIAIVWVMYYHGAVMGLIADGDPVADTGWMGVDLFFALSGYLIGSQLFRPMARGQAPDPWRFYLRRGLRTLPAYLVVLALYFTIPAFRERPRIEPLWEFLTFTENLFIDFSQPKAFSHVWSLCVEEQFYLVMPFAAWLLARRPRASTAITACIVILLGGMALRATIWTWGLEPLRGVIGPGGHTQRYQEWIYYPTWSRLDGLLGGVVLALIAAFRPVLWAAMMRRANLLGVLGLAAIAVSIWMFRDRTSFATTVFGYPLLSLGMAGMVAAAAGPSGLLGRRAIPGAGAVAAMAYSFYLTHKQVYHMAHLAVGDALDHQPILAFTVYAGAALAVGALLYWGVERPFLKLRDRLGARPAAVAAVTA
jgi:peptidoglycan/LPS O-acetylase OafA/YrhL